MEKDLIIDEEKLYSRQEFCKIFNYTESYVTSSFTKMAQAQRHKGYEIIRISSSKPATPAMYQIKKIDPEPVIKHQRKPKQNKDHSQGWNGEYCQEDLPDEIWVTTYINPDYEVSNRMRVRVKETKALRAITPDGKGYYKVSIGGKSYYLHRIVKLSFDPVEDPTKVQIDHIDGNRQNANLENLRYLTTKENTHEMLRNRDKIQMCITEKLAHGYSYNEILEIIKNLPNKI